MEEDKPEFSNGEVEVAPKIKKEKKLKEINPDEEVEDGEPNLTDRIRENPWVASTVILGIIVLIMVIGSFTGFTGGMITGGTIGVADVEEMFLDYLAKDGANIDSVEITDVSTQNGLYKISFNYQGEQYPVPYYMTKDGSLIGRLNEMNVKGETASPTESTFTDEQNSLIKEFTSCLYNKGMRVYYAGWCSACHSFIETFGGLENAGMMMVECQTENQQPGAGADLCNEKKQTSYIPEIQLNDELYEDARTFEAFAEATGCEAPQL